MKKRILLLATIGILFLSCSKDDSTPVEFATVPETKPEVDGTAFGVYKGVLMGADGSLKVVINNGDNLANIYIYKNGVIKDVLTTTETFTMGEAITSAHFESEDASMNFSVNADGTNPIIENASIGLSKVTLVNGYLQRETSDILVYCYEGTYRGREDNGKFKCMINGTQLVGYILTRDSETFDANAVATDNQFNAVFGSVGSGAEFYGFFTATTVSGEWENLAEDDDGTFKGKRSL